MYTTNFIKRYLVHFLIIIATVSIILAFLLWIHLVKTETKLLSAEERVFQTTNQLYDQRITLDLKEATIAELGEQLNLTQEELDDVEGDLKKTKDRLDEEKERNDDIEEQVNSIAGTVSDLDKLSKTDKELLQKYSKVSFLNEHFIPEKLTEIDDEWKYSESKPNSFHAKAYPYLEEMLEEAKDDDIDLWVVSAYRSFSTQAQLKGRYTVIYGSGANAFSADQGFSEHQLGTTVDFTTSGLGGGLNGFGNTVAYEWLLDNAHKYGFVLSYPPNNAYYVFEPWHWRFVGTNLAKDLHKADAYFYDWDQRKIDKYLLNIFD